MEYKTFIKEIVFCNFPNKHKRIHQITTEDNAKEKHR